jgi:hypothetical protein
MTAGLSFVVWLVLVVVVGLLLVVILRLYWVWDVPRDDDCLLLFACHTTPMMEMSCDVLLSLMKGYGI